MISPIFDNGIQGLSDSLWSGTKGSCSKLVGIDYRTTPGTFQAHQKLSKHSSTVVTELCDNVVNVSDGSRLWFSSESGKIWREVSGTYTLVHTTVPTSGEAKCLGAKEYHGEIFWATELYLHKILVEDLGDWTKVTQNWRKFGIGDNEFHPMTVQNLELYIGDKTTIAKVDKAPLNPLPKRTMTTTFDSAVKFVSMGTFLAPTGNKYPSFIASGRGTSASASSVTFNLTIPNVSDRQLVVFVSAVRTDNNDPDFPASIDFGGQTAFLVSTGSGNFGSNVVSGVARYVLTNPNTGTGALTVTFAGAETNIIVQAIVFRDTSSVGNIGTEIETTGASSVSYTLPQEINYQLPLVFINSATTTHTIGSGQVSVFNTTNTWGTDSSSYYGEVADFTQKTEFSIVAPERIQTLADFDIDILVGTRDVNKGRVLRWDGVSEGWSAQDDIEEQGINAFIRDDNYMYVQAGFYGRMYFYNGEKLEPFKRIPGDWSPSKTAKIRQNSTAFHLGVPVFGLSNVAGNPTLQGVYGFGSYGKGYDKTLSLDFPIPTNAFTGVTVGAICTDGADLYVSYKDATDVGVAKLDWSNKYNGAYLETTTLISPKERSEFTNISGINADYVELPANTNISLSYKKSYENDFISLNTTPLTKLKQIKARATITDISNLIVKATLTTSSNTTPKVENLSIEI